jgi:hypothetical protein
MKHLINGFGPHSPVVLSVHHPLNLVRSDQILLYLAPLFLFVHFKIIIVNVGWKSNIAHRSEHLIFCFTFLIWIAIVIKDFVPITTLQSRIVVFVLIAHMLFLNI